MNEINLWTSSGKETVLLTDCQKVTARKSIFYATCQNGKSGEINLDDFNLILKTKPEVIDEKALELREVREKLKLMFGHRD